MARFLNMHAYRSAEGYYRMRLYATDRHGFDGTQRVLVVETEDDDVADFQYSELRALCMTINGRQALFSIPENRPVV